MKFGLLFVHQQPRPWDSNSERVVFQNSLEQASLADRLGFDYIWAVEHHFLEEYSHLAAPEVFLAACSQNTERIRLGHGIKQVIPNYNHPARSAESLASLDLISNGRLDIGTGEGSTAMELDGFQISLDQKRAMYLEATEQIANMMVMDPYPGHQGDFFSMPCRSVVPKPLQKPHPPLWMACSQRKTIRLAAELGLGALAFLFIDPEEAKQWVREYYDIIRSENCVPIGHVVNPNVCMVSSFFCHEDREFAFTKGKEGFDFFSFSLKHLNGFGQFSPGITSLWDEFHKSYDKDEAIQSGMRDHVGGIGTPGDIKTFLDAYARAGVDQVTFVHQVGRYDHEEICESMKLFAREVMPEFSKNEDQRERVKEENLAPYKKSALNRKIYLNPVKPNEIGTVDAFGRQLLSN